MTLRLDGEVEEIGNGIPIAVTCLDERLDLSQHRLALLVPLSHPAKNESALSQAGEMYHFSPGTPKFHEFLTKRFEKRQFESVSSLSRGSHKGNRNWRCQWLQLLGDGAATDGNQHLPEALKQLFKLKKLQGTLVFQIKFHPAPDLADQWEVFMISRFRSPQNRDLQPRSIVVDHLILTDLDCRTVAYKGNHEAFGRVLEMVGFIL